MVQYMSQMAINRHNLMEEISKTKQKKKMIQEEIRSTKEKIRVLYSILLV